MFSLKTKILAFLSVIGAAILAAFAYKEGRSGAEEEKAKEDLERAENTARKTDSDSVASAAAHNEAVSEGNAARKESDEQNEVDRAAVRDAPSLRDEAAAINAAIDRTNDSV